MAGATGAVGVPLVRELVERGHDVIGVTRSEEAAKRFRPVWAQAVVADVLDVDALLAAARSVRADVVVHELTAIPGLPMRHRDLDHTNQLRTAGTANLLRLASRVGATRFVAQSFLGGYGYGDHGRKLLTEEDGFGRPGANPGLERIIAALRSVEQQTLGTSELAGVALRYGLFYGPGGPLELMVRMLRRRMLPVPADGGGTSSYVYLPDAAIVTAAAVERGRPGQVYNICDDEPVGWSTMISAVADTFGTPQPLPVPRWLFRPTPMAHQLMSSSIAMSNAKARSELDWSPLATTYREGLARARRQLAGSEAG